MKWHPLAARWTRVILSLFLSTGIPSQLWAQNQPPRASLGSFRYLGSFRTPFGRYGECRIAFNPGGNQGQGSLFLTGGGANTFTIGEISIPELVSVTQRSQRDQLRTAAVLQARADIYSRIPQKGASWPSGNVNSYDNGNHAVFGGLYFENGKLYFNAYTYYDAGGQETVTTGRIENPSSLTTSAIAGMFRNQGAARTSGWISPIPPEWVARLGGTHVTANDNSLAILSRASAGPSLFAFNLADWSTAGNGATIPTTPRLNFPEPAGARAIWGNDMVNVSKTNRTWTLMTMAGYGFVVPGTRTYALFGTAGGFNANPANPWHGTAEPAFVPPIAGTIAYKRTDTLGYTAGGRVVWDAQDRHYMYALFDLDEILAASDPWLPRPYENGVFPAPFARYGNYTQAQMPDTIRSGAWDPIGKRLYLALSSADNDAEPEYTGEPVIAVYELASDTTRLTITSPNGAESWRRNETRAITWTAAGVSENLTIELMQGPTLLGVIATGIAPASGSFTWTVGRLADGTFITGTNLKIRIRTASGQVMAEARWSGK